MKQFLDQIATHQTEGGWGGNWRGAVRGLKTIGKYDPELLTEWLLGQTKHNHRAVMGSKTLAYLPRVYRKDLKGS